MANTVEVNWQIANTETLQTETVGNDANRFDTWRQSTTLGPEPASAPSGPPETGDITNEGQ